MSELHWFMFDLMSHVIFLFGHAVINVNTTADYYAIITLATCFVVYIETYKSSDKMTGIQTSLKSWWWRRGFLFDDVLHVQRNRQGPASYLTFKVLVVTVKILVSCLLGQKKIKLNSFGELSRTVILKTCQWAECFCLLNNINVRLTYLLSFYSWLVFMRMGFNLICIIIGRLVNNNLRILIYFIRI